MLQLLNKIECFKHVDSITYTIGKDIYSDDYFQ